MIKYNYLFYGYKGSCVIIGHLFSNHLFVKFFANKSNFTFQCLKMQQLLNARTTKYDPYPACVQATGGNICCNKHINLTILKLLNRPSLNCYKIHMYCCSSMKYLKRKRNENLTSDKYIRYITSCNIFPCIRTCGMSWSFRRSATKYDVDALLQKTIVGWGSFFCFIFSNCKTRSSAKKVHIDKLELMN